MSVAQIMLRLMTEHVVNKGLGYVKKWSWLNLRFSPTFFWRDWGKQRKTSVGIEINVTTCRPLMAQPFYAI